MRHLRRAGLGLVRARTLVVIVSIVGVFVISACGSSSSGDKQSTTSDTSTPVTLKVVDVTTSPEDQQPWRKLYDEFEKDNPSIKVDLSFIPLAQYPGVLRTRLLGGNAPDVFHINGGHDSGDGVFDLAPTGRLLPLDGQSNLANIPKVVQPLASYQGKTYAWFNDLSGIYAFYNKDLYAKAGVEPPQTFDQVLAACKAIRSKTGADPFVIGGALPNSMYQLNFALAASSVLGVDPNWNTERDQGKTTFAASAGWKDQFNEYLAMRDASCFNRNPVSTSFPAALTKFTKGKAATMVVISVVRGALASNPKIKLGAYAIPGTNDASQTRLALSPVSGMAVSARTKHKDAALKLINWLADPANNRKYGDIVGGLAATEAAKGNLPSDLSDLKTYYSTPGKSVAHPILYWPAETAAGVLAPDMQALYLNKTTIPKALANLDRSYDQGS